MIDRFEWRNGRSPPVLTTRPRPLVRWLTGWHIIGGLTTLFLLWLGYRWLVQPAWPEQLPPLLAESLILGEAAAAFTLALIWLGLIWRHRAELLAPSGPAAGAAGPSLDMLYALSPADFERYVADLFRQKGYRVTVRGRSGDAGVDLELSAPTGKRAIVQCKRYQKSIGPEIVRELFGTMIHERAAHAFLVTTADISATARDWARGKPITLIDGRTLVAISASLAQRRP